MEFQITLKGERKVIDEQAAEIRAMTEGMKSILEAVAECGEADRQAIKEQLNEEIKKVYSFKRYVTTVQAASEQSRCFKHLSTNCQDVEIDISCSVFSSPEPKAQR